MTEKKTKASSSPKGQAEDTPLTLEAVLIALQKTFSRVSAQSAEVPEEQARALVTGPVQFSFSLKLDPQGDSLHLSPRGNIEMNLSGTIDTDVRITDEESPVS